MSEKTANQIASKIRGYREQRGYTQKELSSHCGLSTNYISRIERADVTLSVDSLEKLCKALKVSSSDILSF